MTDAAANAYEIEFKGETEQTVYVPNLQNPVWNGAFGQRGVAEARRVHAGVCLHDCALQRYLRCA